MQGKYKSIGNPQRKEEIIQSFLSGTYNMSQLAKVYVLPYSTLRRFIKEEIKNRDLEEQFQVQYFNVEDFPYLRVGDTFQFSLTMQTWKVVSITRKESDKVFELVPSRSRGEKHYICDEEVA